MPLSPRTSVETPFASREPPLRHPTRRIGVFRALQLGDLLCSVPAFQALRAAQPQAHITLIGLPWAQIFVERYRHLFDGFIAFPGHPALPEQTPRLAEWPRFLAQVQAQTFDLVIQLHGGGLITNPLVAQFGARRYAGLADAAAYRPAADSFIGPPAGSELQALLKTMVALGAPDGGTAFDFPLTAADTAEFDALPEAPMLRATPYICVHPGARGLTRRWFASRFAAVADDLAARGFQIVLTGSAAEHAIVDAVKQLMRHPALDLCGRTSLGALAAVLRHARLLVCNDTGVSHLAAGLQVPSVVVVTGSDPGRWAPENRARHRVVLQPIDCRPCRYDVCHNHHACATAIGTADVTAQAFELLEQENHCAA